MTVGAVIFDCDGVLADSEWASAAAWQDTLERYGFLLSPEEFARFIGTTDRDLAETFGPRLGIDPEVILSNANDRLRAILSGGLESFADAVGLLGRLDVPVAVASNSDRWRLDAVLAAAGLAGRFKVSVGADEVGQPKPAPDVYLRAAELLAIDPADCLVIEDSPTGIEAARKAGMGVIAVDRGHFPRESLEPADQVVGSLEEIQSW
ncbi:MAG TPA: HAD family phosphatase [Acidimicrobiia bacterium]|nr:HAD family phosphatase [Acidimicrobiia bacterium]